MNPVITLTGQTCSGKTTIERRLVGLGYARVISTTTRAPRANEVNGVSYHFVDEATFMATPMVESVMFGNTRYGITRRELEARIAVAPTVIVVEPHGCEQIRDWCYDMNVPFLPVWVESARVTRLRRFLKRVCVDHDACRDARDESSRMIATHADRLILMERTEVHWARRWRNACEGHGFIVDNHRDEDLMASVEAIGKKVSELPTEVHPKRSSHYAR